MSEKTHYLSEQDAAKSVCPLSVGAGMNNKIIIINGLEVGRACIGSRCLAWRWEPIWNDDGDDYEYGERGYCGMIGES